MIPVLNERFMLLKQNTESSIYPLFDNKDARLLSSGSFEYDKINQVAAEILSLCDGTNSVNDIIIELSKLYQNNLDEIAYMVNTFIEEASSKEYIKFIKNKNKRAINVAGDFNTIYPFFVTFEITKRCPLKCKHCYNHSGKARQNELSSEQIIEVLYKLKNIGVQKIMLTGGEPLAKEGFTEILEIATNLFLGVSIGSNGYLINKEFVNSIRNFNKNMVFQISVDGMEKSHDAIRGVEGSFTRAINALELLSSSGINAIVSNTVNTINFSDMEEVARIVKSKGAKQLNFSNTLDIGRASNSKLNEDFNNDEFNKMIIRLHEKYSDNSFYINADKIIKKVELNHCASCGAGDYQVCVRENSDISPCLHFSNTIGNIFTNDVKDIFDSKKVNIFRKTKPPKTSLCIECQKCPGCIAYAA